MNDALMGEYDTLGREEISCQFDTLKGVGGDSVSIKHEMNHL